MSTKGKKLAPKFRRLAYRRIRQLKKYFDRIVDQADSEAVHDFRKSTRHLQAVVETCESQSRKTEKLRGNLRKFRHVLGEWRDTEVLLAELRKVQRHHGYSAERPYWRELAADILKAHEKATKTFFRRRKSLKVKATTSGLKKLVKKEYHSATLMHDLQGELANRWKKWVASIEDFVADNTATALHGVRIKSKGLRYALKLTLYLYPDEELEACADWLKEIQDRLGAWHDEMTLAQRALKSFAALPREPDALKVIRRIKENEISLAEAARDFITPIRMTHEYACLRRRLSATVFALADADATSSRSDDLIEPIS